MNVTLVASENSGPIGPIWNKMKRARGHSIAKKQFKKRRVMPLGRVPQATRTEKKSVDTSTALTMVQTSAWGPAGGPLLMNGMLQGTSDGTRVGRRVQLKSIQFRYTAASLTTNLVGTSPFRIMVVFDKQPNAATPAFTDIFTTNAFDSNNNLSNRERFVTLIDHMSDRCSQAGNDNSSTSASIFRKIDNPVYFNTGNAGTVADITGGAVWLMVAHNGNFTIAVPTFGYQCRIRYTDD